MPKNSHEANNEFTFSDIAPHMWSHLLSNDYLSPEDTARLACTNRFFNHELRQANQCFRMKALQQAVLDGDIPVMDRILDAHSELLLQEPEQKNVIQSQLTRKKVFGEVPFTMALKTRQVKVIKAMLPYIRNIENGRQQALVLWDSFDLLPVKKPYPFKSLIDVIAQEPFLNGGNGKLSDATEQALKAFRDSVTPQEVIVLQDDYDLLGHLDSAVMVLEEHHLPITKFTFYAVRVIGTLQSLLQREHAQVQCHGLWKVLMDNEEPNSKEALDLTMHGLSFYHPVREYRLGVDIFCGYRGDVCRFPGPHDAKLHVYYEKLIAASTNELTQLKSQLRREVLDEGYLKCGRSTRG